MMSDHGSEFSTSLSVCNKSDVKASKEQPVLIFALFASSFIKCRAQKV